MGMTIENMLSLSEVYFTDGAGKYRLQWSNKALICNYAKPDIDDYYDEEDNELEEDNYFADMAKYELIQGHLNDGSEKAASYRINIYERISGNYPRIKGRPRFYTEKSCGLSWYNTAGLFPL